MRREIEHDSKNSMLIGGINGTFIVLFPVNRDRHVLSFHNKPKIRVVGEN